MVDQICSCIEGHFMQNLSALHVIACVSLVVEKLLIGVLVVNRIHLKVYA